MRYAIGMVSTIGATLFGALLLVSLVHPAFVERQGLRLIEIEVERRVGEELQGPLLSNVDSLLQRVHAGNAREIERLRAEARERLPVRIAEVVRQMQDSSCACRAFVARALSGLAAERVQVLESFNAGLERMIQTRYGEVVSALVREFRIFTGVNAALFGALGLVMLRVRKASVHLVPAGLLLVMATLLSAYFYLFQQDWMHTIVFGDYVGFAYAGYIGAIALLLADIAFLHGMVTTAALNALAGAVGAAASVAAC